MKNHIDTTEILKVYRENPKKGFELIYKNYSGPVFRYLRNSFNLSREEAEDILQNVFLPWVKEPEKLFAVENLSAYLFTSARNAALKFKNTGRTAEMKVEPAGNPHDERIETGLEIDRALNELPVEQKEAVVLKVWINMTFEEIAGLQQCSLQTVASRYRYALAKLKELIPWQK
ncbi:MAG: RNA polymerase sigma factor [Candidatus Riflebacteria bacterium]